LKRYELLRLLRSAGWNDFQAFRSTDARRNIRFPVFLRRENDHDGGRTPLLRSEAELRRALRALLAAGYRMRELLIVEFCDVSVEPGVFRKYSAFRIGDRILPRRLLFGSDWMVKSNSEALIGEKSAAEETAFVEGNPHEEALREIFRLARIEYGRIDYGVRDNRVQTLEINTNPTLFVPVEKYHPLSLPVQHEFSRRFADALGLLDGGAGEVGSIVLGLPPEIVRGMNRVVRGRHRARAREKWKYAVARRVPVLTALLRRARAATVPIRKWALLAANRRASSRDDAGLPAGRLSSKGEGLK
jgi:hypothetical protein